MLTVQRILELLPDGSAPYLAVRIRNFLSGGHSEGELQEWLEAIGVVSDDDTSVSAPIFRELAATPPPPPAGPRGPAGSPAPVGVLAVVVVLLAIVAAIIYYRDSKVVDGNFEAVKARMPEIVRAEFRAALSEEFLAAAPTWAKPKEPKCVWDQSSVTVEDCVAQKSEVCAMRCCADWAQQNGVLGAQCRLAVGKVLGPPASYPPPPTPPPTTPSS